jgi:hypothetical protein
MQTREAIQQQSRHDPKNKMVYIMDFVQDFRREPSAAAIAKILPTTPEESALLAAVVETLCIETRDTATSIPLPEWVRRSEPLKTPYFVSGVENLKAIALVESPVPFAEGMYLCYLTFSCGYEMTIPAIDDFRLTIYDWGEVYHMFIFLFSFI